VRGGVGGEKRGRERERERERRQEGEISDEGEKTIARRLAAPSAPFAASFLLFFNPDPFSSPLLSLSLCSLSLLSKPPKTEDNVDSLVAGGAVRNVVPLLTMFKVDEGRGVST
jgi:hypothetical protein